MISLPSSLLGTFRFFKEPKFNPAYFAELGMIDFTMLTRNQAIWLTQKRSGILIWTDCINLDFLSDDPENPTLFTDVLKECKGYFAQKNAGIFELCFENTTDKYIAINTEDTQSIENQVLMTIKVNMTRVRYRNNKAGIPILLEEDEHTCNYDGDDPSVDDDIDDELRNGLQSTFQQGVNELAQATTQLFN